MTEFSRISSQNLLRNHVCTLTKESGGVSTRCIQASNGRLNLITRHRRRRAIFFSKQRSSLRPRASSQGEHEGTCPDPRSIPDRVKKEDTCSQLKHGKKPIVPRDPLEWRPAATLHVTVSDTSQHHVSAPWRSIKVAVTENVISIDISAHTADSTATGAQSPQPVESHAQQWTTAGDYDGENEGGSTGSNNSSSFAHEEPCRVDAEPAAVHALWQDELKRQCLSASPEAPCRVESELAGKPALRHDELRRLCLSASPDELWESLPEVVLIIANQVHHPQ